MKEYEGRDDLRFVVVYQREPHARQMAFRRVGQPTSYAERVALAKKTLTELRLGVEVWVDDLGDASRAAFGDVPNPAVVIDGKGIVRMKLSWSDPKVLGRFLPDVLPKPSTEAPKRAEDAFLAAIGEDGSDADATPAERRRARHHRDAMLASLVVRYPKHVARGGWLAELATQDAPAWQRAWVQRLRQAASAGEKPEKR